MVFRIYLHIRKFTFSNNVILVFLQEFSNQFKHTVFKKKKKNAQPTKYSVFFNSKKSSPDLVLNTEVGKHPPTPIFLNELVHCHCEAWRPSCIISPHTHRKMARRTELQSTRSSSSASCGSCGSWCRASSAWRYDVDSSQWNGCIAPDSMAFIERVAKINML